MVRLIELNAKTHNENDEEQVSAPQAVAELRMTPASFASLSRDWLAGWLPLIVGNGRATFTYSILTYPINTTHTPLMPVWAPSTITGPWSGLRMAAATHRGDWGNAG